MINKIETTKLTGGSAVPKSTQEASPKQPTDSVAIGSTNDQMNTPKQWLIINYIAGDNNLVNDQVANLNQMEAVGSDENTHIVTYIDQGPKKVEGMPFSGAGLLYVTKDNDLKNVSSTVLETYGDSENSGNWQNLMKVIIGAVTKHPAINVALILNNHGGAFTGGMSDDTQAGSMTVPDFKKALDGAKNATGKKLDLIGFDACLMAEFEVAYQLKDYANILIASEESEGGPGWDYTGVLKGKGGVLGNMVLPQAIKETQQEMKKKGFKFTGTPEQLAKRVVDICAQHPELIPTFSAIDLKKLEELKESTNKLADALQNTTDKDSIRKAIAASECYGDGWQPYRDIHDMKDMANKIIDKVSDEKVIVAAKQVIKSFESAIIANENNPGKHPNSFGLSIYAPVKLGDYEGFKDKYEELDFAQKSNWDEAIQTFAAPGTSQEEIGKLQEMIEETIAVQQLEPDSPEYKVFKLMAQRLAEKFFVVLRQKTSEATIKENVEPKTTKPANWRDEMKLH